MAMKGTFIDNLPKVYGMYTGGFLVFIALMAFAERMGMSAEAIGTTTLAVGWVFSTTVKAAVAPASVVVRPAVGATEMPGVSSSWLTTATSAPFRPL